MKNRLLIPFILIIAFFGLVSCSQNVQTHTDVSLDFSAQEIFDAIAAREGVAEGQTQSQSGSQTGSVPATYTATLSVSLFVNGDYSASQTKTVTQNDKNKTLSFVFHDITIGAKVMAKASVVYNNTVVLFEGESKEKTVTEKPVELDLELKPTQNYTPYVPVTPETDNLIVNYYIQKIDAAGKPVAGEYEEKPFRTISCHQDNESSDTQLTLDDFDDDFYTKMIWTEYELTIYGFECPDDNPEISYNHGCVYMDYYCNKSAETADCVTLQGSASGSSGASSERYNLHLYNYQDCGLFDITDSDNKFVFLGEWYADEDTHTVTFQEIMYQKDGEIKFVPSFYKDGKLDLEGSLTNSQATQTYWKNGVTNVILTYFFADSSIQITFSVSDKFDIYKFADKDPDYMGETVVPVETDNPVVLQFFTKDITGSDTDAYSIYKTISTSTTLAYNDILQNTNLIMEEESVKTYFNTYDSALTANGYTRLIDSNGFCDAYIKTTDSKLYLDFHYYKMVGGQTQTVTEVSTGGNIIILPKPGFIISELNTYTTLGKNDGYATFEASSHEIEKMTATLYYDGNEVDSSTYYFENTTPKNQLHLYPNYLDKAGTYIAHITAKSTTGIEVHSNFIIEVQDFIIADLDITDNDFLQSLINTFSKANGSLKLNLSGNKSIDGTYSKEYNLYQLMRYCINQYPVAQLEIDMSDVSGSIADIFETSGYSKLVSKLILPTDTKAIRYTEDMLIDISESSGDYTNATWYALYCPYTNGKNYIESIINGTTEFIPADVQQFFTTNFVNDYDYCFEQLTWQQVCTLLNGNPEAREFDSGTVIIRGE